MLEKINALIVGVSVLAGCSESAPEIHTLCERDEVGNYIIKWEVDPMLEGVVKCYISDNPDEFPDPNPVLYGNISDGVATYVTRDNVTRSYFKLTFNDKYPQVVSERVLRFDHALNFRDLGGYAAGKKAIRWGRVYRSGEFLQINDKDSILFSDLGIRTVIDLREEKEVALHPMPAGSARIVSIPVPLQNSDNILELIREGKMRKRDALLYIQDQYLNFMDNYSEQFAEALSLFENADNYPILFNCSFGKDRTGFLATLLLSAMGVPEEEVLRDFTLSTTNVHIGQINALARDLDTEGQEAVTILLSSSETIITPTFQKIRREYGSMDNYLDKKMQMTDEKRKKIKDILLR